MSLRSFLKLVEIQTKVASVIPFLLGTFYAVYRFQAFHPKNFVLMFVSLLCIDMATTAINNYQDFKKANKRHGYGYERHNAIVRDNLKESTVLFTIFILLAIAITFGILLYLNTDMVVLMLGTISFLIGILYSFGPVPISRTPLGEIFSGGFMGLVIPFISTYIHVFDRNLVDLALQGGKFFVEIDLREVFYIILFSIPAVVGIANIMLANNICDIEDDVVNKRYTLPIFIGKENALRVFAILYIVGYIALAILLFLRVVPAVFAITFGTFVLVYRNVKVFYQKQTKKDTFVVAVKNFVLMNAALTVTIAIAAIITLSKGRFL